MICSETSFTLATPSPLPSYTHTSIHLKERYPTTEDDDTALMSDRKMFKGLPQNARNAIRLRRTEKRLLKRTIATSERRLVQIRTGVLDPAPQPWKLPPKRFDKILDDIGVELKP